MLAAALPSAAGAQELPACAPDAEPLLSFGLPSEAIEHRWYDVALRRRQSDRRFALRQKVAIRFRRGGVEWDDTVDTARYESFWFSAEIGSGPVTVEADYVEHQVTSWGDEEEEGAPWELSQAEREEMLTDGSLEFYGGEKVQCRRTVSATVGVRAGLRQPTPTLWTFREAWADPADVQVRVRKPSGCRQRYAAQPFVFSVRRQGSRSWTSVASADPCTGWEKGGRGAGVRLDAGSSGTLTFTPLVPARTGTTSYRFRIAQGSWSYAGVNVGRTLRSGRFVVRTIHSPTRRVYAIVGGRSNPAYWNYCVRYGRDVWQTDDNVFCISPRETLSNIAIRR